MNPAPDQPPVSTISSTSSINSPPNPPQIPSSPTPAITNLPKQTDNSQYSTNKLPPVVPPNTTYSSPPSLNYQPPTNNSPPPPMNNQPLSETNIPPPHKKFPFMMVTLFLVIILAGFAGSFLFFSYTNTSSQKVPAQILITPPVSVAPTQQSINPFATSSAELVNPFTSPTASLTNPFGSAQNPFSSATKSAENQSSENPFGKLK